MTEPDDDFMVFGNLTPGPLARNFGRAVGAMGVGTGLLIASFAGPNLWPPQPRPAFTAPNGPQLPGAPATPAPASPPNDDWRDPNDPKVPTHQADRPLGTAPGGVPSPSPKGRQRNLGTGDQRDPSSSRPMRTCRSTVSSAASGATP
jgi:hypothetical protein